MRQFKKGSTRKVQLYESDEKLLYAASAHLGMTQQDILTRLLSAGLHALAENGCVLPLPLKFSIEPPLRRS